MLGENGRVKSLRRVLTSSQRGDYGGAAGGSIEGVGVKRSGGGGGGGHLSSISCCTPVRVGNSNEYSCARPEASHFPPVHLVRSLYLQRPLSSTTCPVAHSLVLGPLLHPRLELYACICTTSG